MALFAPGPNARLHRSTELPKLNLNEEEETDEALSVLAETVNSEAQAQPSAKSREEQISTLRLSFGIGRQHYRLAFSKETK
jgi:hypothetical protein